MIRELKENMGFSIVLKTDATDADIAGLKAIFAKAPYVAKTTFISKDQALEQWQKDTGENLVETFGVNPLSAEFQVNVKANYAEIGKLKSIQAQLMHQSGVEDIALYETEVETTNKNIGNITIVLLFVAALLVFISFALINNTVRLTVYSRRFLIHTMKLVGAKPGFIRRPFVVQIILRGARHRRRTCGHYVQRAGSCRRICRAGACRSDDLRHCCVLCRQQIHPPQLRRLVQTIKKPQK